mmetsp:Transcript_136747/g.381137  ORF Transcript_136747/g.381137 Transcript_136747/m.381137 type:complete len:92 (-) Transcript_136747:436-711(-)
MSPSMPVVRGGSVDDSLPGSITGPVSDSTNGGSDSGTAGDSVGGSVGEAPRQPAIGVPGDTTAGGATFEILGVVTGGSGSIIVSGSASTAT